MVSRISGIRNKASVKSTRFNFGGKKISVSFLKGEALGFHVYGPRYKELSFSKTYQGLPLLRNLVGVLGDGLFSEVFPEIEPTLRFLTKKFPKEALLRPILKINLNLCL